MHEPLRARVSLWRWIVATGVGLSLGFALDALVAELWSGRFGAALGKSLAWPTVGAAQWLALRETQTTSRGWVGTYVLVGMTVGVFAFAVQWESGDVPAVAGGVILGLMAGLVGGFGQWRVLRRHYVGAGSWVVASLLGWVLGLTFGFGSAHALNLVGSRGGAGLVSQAVTGLLGGLSTGIVTGVALMRLVSVAGRQVLEWPSRDRLRS